MRKLGAASGTTTEFTLHDTSVPGGATSTGSRQDSVTEFDNQPKTATNDVLPPTDLGIFYYSMF